MSILVAFLLACSPSEPPPAPEGPVSCAQPTLSPIDLEAPTGLSVTDSTWTTPWAGERTNRLYLWYETDATSGTPVSFGGVTVDELAWVDAPYARADEDCTHPLVVFSHGHGGWGGVGSTVLRQFVNAGWVGVAPDHTGNTALDNVEPKPASYALQRVEDVKHAIDWAETLPAEHPLAGRIDTSRVLVTGHSRGGQTAWLLSGPTFDADAVASGCAQNPPCTDEALAAFAERPTDPRVVGVVPMAGAVSLLLVDEEGWSTMDVPALYLTGSEDYNGTNSFERASVGDVTWAEIAGGCHMSFVDTPTVCQTLDGAEGLEIIARYATAFGSHTVLESDDQEVLDILDGTTVVSDLVTLAWSR